MYVLYRNRNYKINKKSAGHGTNIKKKKKKLFELLRICLFLMKKSLKNVKNVTEDV